MEKLEEKLKKLQERCDWQGILALVNPELDRTEGKQRNRLLSYAGFALSQLGDFDAALERYQEWAKAEPRSAMAHYCVGYVYAQKQQYPEAVAWYDKALRLRPNYIVCLYRKGVALLNWNKPRGAIPVLQKVLDVYAASSEDTRRRNQKYLVKATFELGKALYAARRYQEARQMFAWVRDNDKKSYLDAHFVYYNLGKTALEMGDYAVSEEMLLRALELAPDKEYLWERLGRLEHNRKRFNKALEYYGKALERRFVPYVLVSRAETHLAMGNRSQAVRDLLDAVRRDRLGKHKIWVRLAEIAVEDGRPELAERNYRKAIDFKQRKYQTDCAEARYGLARLYWDQGETEKAREELRKAVLANPHLSWDRRLFQALELPFPVHGFTFEWTTAEVRNE